MAKPTKKPAAKKKKAGPKKDSKLSQVRAKRHITVSAARDEPSIIGGSVDETVQNIKDRNLDSVPEKVKSGLLDPTDFDLHDIETLRPKAAETERIAFAVQALLNREYSLEGKYEWVVGFFLPGDPATDGAGGWKPLAVDLIRPHWTNEFRATVGLHDWEGAVCWSGRGRMDRHVLCVMTTKLRDQKREMHQKHTMEQFEQIETPAAAGRVEITEEVIKGKVGPDSGAGLNDDTIDATKEAAGA